MGIAITGTFVNYFRSRELTYIFDKFNGPAQRLATGANHGPAQLR
jgi:hypothetical protein